MTNTWYASDWGQAYCLSYAKIRHTVVRHIQVYLYFKKLPWKFKCPEGWSLRVWASKWHPDTLVVETGAEPYTTWKQIKRKLSPLCSIEPIFFPDSLLIFRCASALGLAARPTTGTQTEIDTLIRYSTWSTKNCAPCSLSQQGGWVSFRDLIRTRPACFLEG